MRVLEHQAKRLFAHHGLTVPSGKVVSNIAELDDLSYPAVFKAQVPIGGRGKAGGILKICTPMEGQRALRKMLRSKIRGYTVREVLVEDMVSVDRELYLSLIIDKVRPVVRLLASTQGGVDIEDVAKESPEEIVQLRGDHRLGFVSSALAYLADRLSVSRDAMRSVVEGLLDVLFTYDATLAEINPLGVIGDRLIALDGKLIIDDHAAFRQPDLFSTMHQAHADTEYGHLEELGISYLPLDGNVALISDGAGTGMLTLDLISDAGGRAANFCELGGAAGTETMQRALEVVLANRKARSLLISLLGGLTRMDDVARGILAYLREHTIEVPLVVRMCGTQEEAGRAMLRDVGITTRDDLLDAVRVAVDLAKEAMA